MRVRLLPSLTLFAAGFFLASLFGFLFMPYAMRGGATRFADGFSEFEFQMLRRGESMKTVAAAIGEPLAVEPLAAVDAWIYRPADWSGAPHRTGEAAPRERRDITNFTQLQFDRNDRVVSEFGVYLSPLPAYGTPRKEILARYGFPTLRLARPELIAHDYALSAGAPVWKVRRVLYDSNGNLFATIGYTRFSAIRLLPSISPFTPVQ